MKCSMDFKTLVDMRRGGTMGSTVVSFSVFLFLTWVTTQAADINSQTKWGYMLRKEGPVDIKKDTLLTALPYMEKEFSISFEVFIERFTGDEWTNIIHLTTGENSGLGGRIPLVGVSKDKDLHVVSSISGNWNNGGNLKDYKLVENKWIKVDISQNLKEGKYMWTVDVDGTNKMTLENSKPERYQNLKLYVADSWHPTQPGKIRNLEVESSVCPPGWRGMMDGCYFAEASKMVFTEAQNFCKAKNAKMVLANHEREQQGLTKVFSDLTSKKLRFWIDARMIDGTLKTENGEKELSSEAAWGKNDNIRTGDCVRTGSDFKWYKAGCESRGEAGGYTWNPMCKLL